MGWSAPNKSKDYSARVTLETIDQLVDKVYLALSVSSVNPVTCADYLRGILLVLQKVKLEILQELVADGEDMIENLGHPVKVQGGK